MRKSTNYNLNLAEGNDIVNPLVIDVPNYEIIDEELKNNSNSGITTATELLTGSVHTLTRVNKDAPVFRFVATSNYRSGETFTVDGVQVTALMSTGEPLSSGAYVINSNVLCCLTGTLLTVFTCMGGEYTAYDSARLGGKPASDYATNESVNEAVELAHSAADIANMNARTFGKRYIVDYGNNKNGKWVKWSDGRLEMWGQKNIGGTVINSQMGALYFGIVQIDFPIKSLTQVDVLGLVALTNGGIFTSCSTGGDKVNNIVPYIFSANPTSVSASGTLHYYVVGTY